MAPQCSLLVLETPEGSDEATTEEPPQAAEPLHRSRDVSRYSGGRKIQTALPKLVEELHVPWKKDA